jgi:uncharacterized protein
MLFVALPKLPYEYIAYGLALFVGITLGLVGAGGSILTFPILVYVAGIEPKQATSYSLFLVGATALFSTISYFKKGLLHLKTALYFFAPSFIAVFTMRKLILPHIPDNICTVQDYILTKDTLILVVFSTVMLLASFSMIRRKKACLEQTTGTIDFNYQAIAKQGLIVGTLTGLVGAGGGFLIVPALTMFARLPIRLTIGTSLLIVAINSLSGFCIDIASTGILDIDWNFLSCFLGMALIGSLIGTYLSNFIKAEYLRTIFGYFILVIALYMLYRQFLGVQIR